MTSVGAEAAQAATSVQRLRLVNVDSPRQLLVDVEVGAGVVIRAFVNAYGCRIGDRSRVGSFVEIQKGVTIGRDCKISSHSFLCEGVHLGDRVFIGHNVTFINDRFPRATTADGAMQTQADWQCVPTHVRDGASLGSSVTVLCGVTIGEGAMVGAGSVVTRDVPAHSVVAGNPARVLRRQPATRQRGRRRAGAGDEGS